MLFLLLTVFATASEVEVEVNPNGYTGFWSFDGLTAANVGGKVSVEPGNHDFWVGDQRFEVVVRDDGFVTVPGGISAAGGAGELTLIVDDVTFETSSTTPWKVRWQGVHSGTKTVKLVRGVSHLVQTPGGSWSNVKTLDPSSRGRIVASQALFSILPNLWLKMKSGGPPGLDG